MIPYLPSQLVKSGVRPTHHDHRDYDFLKTKKFGAVPEFPAEYNVDAGIWMPNQNEGVPEFGIPPMPFGCTNYAQNELGMDEDGTQYLPTYIEQFTHANANGGGSLRDSLQAVVDHGLQAKNGDVVQGQHQAYFRIQQSGAIDYFDAARLAMLSTSNEKRGVSVGTPWWGDFAPQYGIIQTPKNMDVRYASWHNWGIKGWKTINGEVYLIGKPWLGAVWGDKGFCYFSRPLFNAIMNISGTAMFTLDKLMPNEKAQTVDSNIIQIIVSYVRNLFKIV